MTIEVLHYCVDIRKTGSFTKTAERYHITQQAMSQQIKNLEYELGFRIFTRNNKSVETTEAGRVFLSDMEVLLARIESTVTIAKAHGDGNKGMIRIGFAGPSTKRYLAEIVREFYVTYPGIQILPKLDTQSELFRKISYGVYDLISVGDFLDVDPAIYNTLQWDGGDLVAVVGKSNPLADLPYVTPDQLLEEEYYTLSLSNNEDMRARNMERFIKLVGQPPKKVQYIDDTDSIDILLCGGRGFTLLNCHLEGFHKPELLSFVKVAGPSVRQNVRFVWRKNSKNPALPLFIETARIVQRRFKD